MMNLVRPLRIAASFIGFSCLTGCVHDYWNYKAVPNVPLSVSNPIGSAGPVVLHVAPPPPEIANLPPSALLWVKEHRPNVPVPQTVLVTTYQHDASIYGTHVGRTLVLLLDGNLKPGTYWLTPDNAVLVSYSAYSGPTRERVGLEGSIKIISVKPNAIVADLAVRDTVEVDETNFIDDPWDPLNRQFPFWIDGQRTFAVTTPSDPLFAKTGVKWVR